MWTCTEVWGRKVKWWLQQWHETPQGRAFPPSQVACRLSGLWGWSDIWRAGWLSTQDNAWKSTFWKEHWLVLKVPFIFCDRIVVELLIPLPYYRVFCCCLFCFSVPWIKLKALSLVEKYFTSWTTPQLFLFCFVFQMGSHAFTKDDLRM
jgi:hypothetical protein